MAQEYLNAIRARYTDWPNLHWADGEYRDFAKFDFERAEEEGMGEVRLEFRFKQMAGGVRIERLSQLEENERAGLLGRLMAAPGLQPSQKQDKLMAWHGAHAQDGFVIRVAAGVAAQLIYLRTTAERHSALHHLILLEEGASAEIILEAAGGGTEKTVAPSSPSKTKKTKKTKSAAEPAGAPARSAGLHPLAQLHTDVSEAVLGPDAKLCLTTIQRYAENDWSFSHHDHELGKFSVLTHMAGAFGAGASRTRTLNRLVAGRAKANAYQLFFGRGGQFMDMETHSHHMAGDTSGEMSCRGALDGAAEMVYRGRIHIERAATNTISHQSGAALLLSPNSKANIIPSLQVDNDQVEAGHGASVGALDEGEMNYLRSRGLDEESARLLILRGYFDELVNKIWGADSRRYLSGLIGTRLPKAGEDGGMDSGRKAGQAGSRKNTTKARSKRLRPLAVPGLEARPSAHAGIKDRGMNEGSD